MAVEGDGCWGKAWGSRAAEKGKVVFKQANGQLLSHRLMEFPHDLKSALNQKVREKPETGGLAQFRNFNLSVEWEVVPLQKRSRAAESFTPLRSTE